MVYKTEYSTRRVYSSGSPTPNVSTSYSYSASPIARRRKPLVTTRVIRIPSSMPLSDQEVLNFITTPTRQRTFVSVDPPGRDNNRDENTSFSRVFSSTSSTNSSSNSSGDRPGSSGATTTGGSKTYTKKTETTTRDTGSGPQTYSYTTESTRDDGPGAFFKSTASYKTPEGSSFRHFSYK